MSNEQVALDGDKPVQVETAVKGSKKKKTENGETSPAKERAKTIKDLNEKFNSVMETNQKITGELLLAFSKIEDLVSVCDLLNQRLDELQMMDSPTPAAPVQEVPEDVASGGYATSREVLNTFAKQMERRDGEFANKAFIGLMEKLCLLREDFGKLCKDMSSNIQNYTAERVLSSFEAYLVDIENMITDAGIVIGQHGREGEKIDTFHQRIVGVVPTSDPAKNETVAKILSDGYEYNGRAILKEKVNVYKVAETAPKQSEPEIREFL